MGNTSTETRWSNSLPALISNIKKKRKRKLQFRNKRIAIQYATLQKWHKESD